MLRLLLVINVGDVDLYQKKADWRARFVFPCTQQQRDTKHICKKKFFYGALFQTHNSAFSAFF